MGEGYIFSSITSLMQLEKAVETCITDFKRVICRASLSTSWGARMLIATAIFSFSSKRTVAATWNITLT